MKFYLTQDTTLKLKLAKVVKLLNKGFTTVKFELLPLDYQAPDRLINYPATHNKYLKKLKPKLKEGEYILLLTDNQYDNNYFFEEEKQLIILSLFAWKYLTDLPRENGLVYFICSILMDFVIPWDAVDHTERLGCVNDFLGDKTRVDDGMRKGMICPACSNWLKNNPRDEYLSGLYQDVMSVLRLLSAASVQNMNILESPGETKGAELESFHESVPVTEAVPAETVPPRPAIGMGTTVFISYSHKDEKYRTSLEDHLKILQRLGMISTWTDRMINPGDDWKTAISDNLNKSGIILLLISSSFMASDYCFGIEMKTVLERDEKNEAIAIPIILRDCLWQIGPFAKLKALPKDGKPIQKFTRKDEAYTSIAREICRMIQGN